MKIARGRLLEAVRDPAAGQIVRRQLNGDLVAREDSYEVLSHLTGNVSKDNMAVLECDTEHGIRERLRNRSLHFKRSRFRWLLLLLLDEFASSSRFNGSFTLPLQCSRPTFLAIPKRLCSIDG